MSKRDAILELHKHYAETNTCRLRTTSTRPVFGQGNPRAQIMFIGEAPGKKEGEMGEPFVGSSGKFLDLMLNHIGLKRQTVYITSIVKYRPPKNRDPLSSEKMSCLPWLYAEINLIKPKLIVFLGRHSMNIFFPEKKITDVHGILQTKNFPNISTKYFLPLYHPAAALYDGKLKSTLLKDFKKIPIILSKIKAPSYKGAKTIT